MKLKTIAACLVLALVLALPVQAAGAQGEANITAQMTLKEIRSNPSLAASGYHLYPRGDDSAAILERLWEDEPLSDYVNKYTAGDAAKGLNLVIENYNAGVQVTHQVYTEQEIAAEPALGSVQLFYFPSGTGERKYALVVPGNLTVRCGGMNEGTPTAWKLHELGYNVFVLRYRIFLDAAVSAPFKDVCRAVQYITEHAEQFGVDANNYAVVGYSSGGQLAGLFAGVGCKAYGLPRPAALLLGYPVNDFFEVKPIYSLVLDGGKKGPHYYIENISDVVTADFPPTYHWFGENDRTLALIKQGNQGPKLEQALEQNGVEHVYRVFKNAPHGVGPGTGTDAEGWLEEAAAFWEQQAAE